jgi:hypothetical protein
VLADLRDKLSRRRSTTTWQRTNIAAFNRAVLKRFRRFALEIGGPLMARIEDYA